MKKKTVAICIEPLRSFDMIIGTVAATAIAHLCVSYFAHSLIGSLLLCSLLLFF